MTKKERAILEALYQDAVRIEHRAHPDRDPRNEGFCRGYEWGIRTTLDALGWTWLELFELWNEITGNPAA